MSKSKAKTKYLKGESKSCIGLPGVTGGLSLRREPSPAYHVVLAPTASAMAELQLH